MEKLTILKVRCPTSSRCFASRCFDVARNKEFPVGIFHRARIEKARVEIHFQKKELTSHGAEKLYIYDRSR
jgi:hypothetical protein